VGSPQRHPCNTQASPRPHPGVPGSHQQLTPPSPGSRELRAARLTRQNGIGNGQRTWPESLLPPPITHTSAVNGPGRTFDGSWYFATVIAISSLYHVVSMAFMLFVSTPLLLSPSHSVANAQHPDVPSSQPRPTPSSRTHFEPPCSLLGLEGSSQY
jgi:hypothetical protein